MSSSSAKIHYFAHRKFTNTISNYLDSWGADLGDMFAVHSYDDLFHSFQPKAGVYIFSDAERLYPRQAELAAKRWRALEHAQVPVILLNHPTHVMRRFELLRALHSTRMNRFNVYRLNDNYLPVRFPVFLRYENDHQGAQSPLLHNKVELEAAIARWNMAGRSREDAIITEYVDTKDARGCFRKYSCFIVGDRIIPRHLFFSRHWSVKAGDSFEEEQLEEELQFLRTNPHEEFLSEVARKSCISYGRIDYGVSEGGPQIFEINTNPQIATFEAPGDEKRKEAQALFLNHFEEELKRLLWQFKKKSAKHSLSLFFRRKTAN